MCGGGGALIGVWLSLTEGNGEKGRQRIRKRGSCGKTHVDSQLEGDKEWSWMGLNRGLNDYVCEAMSAMPELKDRRMVSSCRQQYSISKKKKKFFFFP